jgi:CDP-glucose 4,6-dehydratase
VTTRGDVLSGSDPKPSSSWAGELRAAFAGRSVFLTGHTGFKGSWLALWLHELGAQVTGYALDPPTAPSNFERSAVRDVIQADHRADLRDRDRLEGALRASEADVVLHLAAQTVVLEGYASPAETFSVNVVGTAVLLDTIRAVGRPSAVVIVSSDKCYHNDESGRPFEEGDSLGGDDPYSASKAGTELVAAAYRASFFPPDELARHGVPIASARAGNVLGGGDWTAHGIVADIVRALEADRPVALRRPASIRPWQHVLEPLGGYLTLAARLQSPDAARYASAWNFGPEPGNEPTVRELTDAFFTRWGGGHWEDASSPDDVPEAGVLRLSIERARAELGWRPRWSVAEAIERTVDWYRRVGEDPAAARASCLADIAAYMTAGDPPGQRG